LEIILPRFPFDLLHGGVASQPIARARRRKCVTNASRRRTTRRRGKKAPGDSINSYCIIRTVLSCVSSVFYFLFLSRQSMLWKFSFEGKKHARRGIEDEKQWIKAMVMVEVEGDA